MSDQPSTKVLTRPKKYSKNSSNTERNQVKKDPTKLQAKSELEKLNTARNAMGEIFQTSDLIQVKDLQENLTIGKIKYFYQNSKGIVVVYEPTEETEPDWKWEQGCCAIDNVVRA